MLNTWATSEFRRVARTMPGHESVLLDASLSALNIKPDGIYVDATFGRGGHARAILDRLGAGGQLIVFDQDPEAQAVAQVLARNDARVVLEPFNFAELAERLRQRGLMGRVDGVLFDLGVSSPQLDEAERGFSFMQDGPLDMRMNPLAGESAAQYLARVSYDELRRVLREYGDENQAGRVARAIERARAEQAITRTAQLAEIIETALGGRRGRRIHPATRSFQAIRIAVNRELDVLREALPQALEALVPGGRLAVISFHSLEDRIVKQYLRAEANPPAPDPVSPAPPGRLIGLKRRLCDGLEAERNPRARSAVLRWAECRS